MSFKGGGALNPSYKGGGTYSDFFFVYIYGRGDSTRVFLIILGEVYFFTKLGYPINFTNLGLSTTQRPPLPDERAVFAVS